MDPTNAERQRRYIAKLKEQAAASQRPETVLAALAKLQPKQFPKGTLASFAHRVIAEGERLLARKGGMSTDGGRATVGDDP